MGEISYFIYSTAMKIFGSDENPVEPEEEADICVCCVQKNRASGARLPKIV
jgi:hypothetical protein